MKILITGATGLIGTEIVKRCHEQGIAVNYLTTSVEKIESQPLYRGFFWDPEKDIIDTICFEGVEGIINLAGASISKRWTSSYKKKVLNSRANSLHCLKNALAQLDTHQVKQLVSASAIGFYPSSMTKYYEESCTRPSPSFLGEVVTVWENAADDFKALGLKVAKIRIGLVLDEKDGALPAMVKPVKVGLGAPFGSGEQWQSWIHVQDLSEIFLFAVQKGLEGVYNGVAPNPVSNIELTKSIAKILHKPLFMPHIPEVAMKLLLGEMHILLFESQRVSSKKIENAGYDFVYPNLYPALENLLR